jgi:hypothetical protein
VTAAGSTTHVAVALAALFGRRTPAELLNRAAWGLGVAPGALSRAESRAIAARATPVEDEP